MSARRRDGHAARPELALGLRVVGVVAVERGHVVGDREAGLAGVEQLAEPRVRVLGAAEAREHAHRPRPRAVARRVDAAGERRLAGHADVALEVHVRVPAGALPERVAVVVDGGRAAGARVVGSPARVGAGSREVPRAVEALDREVAQRHEPVAALGQALERGLEALHPPGAGGARPGVRTVAHGGRL